MFILLYCILRSTDLIKTKTGTMCSSETPHFNPRLAPGQLMNKRIVYPKNHLYIGSTAHTRQQWQMKAYWDCLLKQIIILVVTGILGGGEILNKNHLYLNPASIHLPNVIFCGKPLLVPLFHKSHFKSYMTHQTQKNQERQKTQDSRNFRGNIDEIPTICCWWWFFNPFEK